MSRILRVCQFGAELQSYTAAFDLQKALAAWRKTDDGVDTLLQLQHPPLYTVGKRGKDDHFKVPAEEIERRGFSIHKIDRGGEVTYHGPGQIVMYPIVHLRQLKLGARAYVEGLEDVMVRMSGIYGISARGQVPGRTGVWIGDKKIGAVGVRISQAVSTHGICFNVSTSLSHYDAIVPCGQKDKEVTSLERELDQTVDFKKAENQLVEVFAERFKYDSVEAVSASGLRTSVPGCQAGNST
ncbi:hypothetical protein BSKO_08869 [Bryopsis sp. KO-2023]|nr:hypothetical protein BSKO_08869 [Bryopsis sp. KO-2023]